MGVDVIPALAVKELIATSIDTDSIDSDTVTTISATITQTTTTGSGLTVSRNLGSASTNSPIVTITNSNVGDDQPSLKIVNAAASASSLDIEHSNAAGYGLDIDGYAGDSQFAGIRVQCTTTSGYAAYFRKNVASCSEPPLIAIQDSTTGSICALELKQDDTDVEFIDCIGTDTGSVATNAGASDASILIAINGTPYKCPLFTV